jgi:hypothetical protein
MSKASPWFERPWKRTGTGLRSWVAAAGYMAAGIGGVVLAAIGGESAVVRFGWMFFAVVFMLLGITLLATLRRRTR